MNAPSTAGTWEMLLVRRNRWMLALAASPFVAAAILACSDAPPPGGFLAFLAIVGVATVRGAYARNLWPTLVPTSVHADAGGVRLGTRAVRRRDIDGGFVFQAGDNATRVLLRRRFHPSIALQVASADEGRALLRALGLDVSQAVATFSTLSRAHETPSIRRGFIAAWTATGAAFLCAIAFSPAGAAAFGVMGFAILALCAAATILYLTPTELRTGADGVALSWFGRRRFIGHGDILRIRHYTGQVGKTSIVGVALHLRSGEVVRVPIGAAHRATTELAIVAERIREGVKLHAQHGDAADAAVLQRGARAPAAWVTALRALGAGANADLRTAPLPRERLFHILESASSSPVDRAAAAVALGAELDDDSRTRLRSAAAAAAAPRLRFAIEEAARGADEAALEAALAEIEAETPGLRPKKVTLRDG